MYSEKCYSDGRCGCNHDKEKGNNCTSTHVTINLNDFKSGRFDFVSPVVGL
jgi:hypothetical protein